LRGPMRILAIDTALEACAAGVVETPDRVLAQENAAMARGHAEALMPLLARVMDQASLRFHHLDRIALTVGPGSFTGLRVGMARGRGSALASGKPAVGVSTLAAFASPYLSAGEKQTVAAVVDARHDHVYFEMLGPGGRILVTPRLIPVRDAVRSASGAAVVVGSGAAVLARAWPEGTPRPPIEAQAAPQITAIPHLGAAAESGPP